MKTQTIIKIGDHAVVRTFCGSFSDMDHLYEELHAETRPFNRPAINIVEMDTEYLLQLALPGYHKESLQVGILGDTLIIEAASSAVPSWYREVRRFYKREFAPESFVRTFLLPEDIVQASAVFNNGILTIHLDRGKARRLTEEERCHRQPVSIQ